MRREKCYDGINRGKVLLTFFLIIGFCLSNLKVSAENTFYALPGSGKGYDWKDVMNRYECYGMDYQINSLRYQLETAKALTAEETYTNAQSDYLYVQARIQELTAAKERLTNSRNELLARSAGVKPINEASADESGTSEANISGTVVDGASTDNAENMTDQSQVLVSEVDTQLAIIETELASYQQSVGTLSKTSSDAKLSQDLADFYKTFQGLLIQDGKNKAKHNFLQSCLNLITNQEEIKYDVLNQDYIKMQKQAEEIKYQYGYSIKGRVDDISLSLSENDRVSAQDQDDYNFLNFYVKREAGISDNDTIQYNLVLNHNSYTVANKVNSFMQNSLSYLQLKNMEISYQNYLSSSGITSSTYRNQIELTVKSYQLQSVQLQRKIEDYVRKAINAYEGSFWKMTTAKTELDRADNKCKIIEESLKHKKASKIDVKKAYLDRQSVSLKYYSCCVDVMLWEDILNNNIYSENE